MAGSAAQPLSPKLVYSTYVGEGPNIMLHALAVDSAGFAYIAGNGQAPDGVTNCSFIAQLDQSGAKLVWNVCLPFAEIDGLAVDSAGYVYLVALDTPSSKSPSTVMKLAPVTHEVIYSTAVQGSNARLALDKAGNAYILGLANAAFQSTPGAYSSSAQDLGFVEKLDSSGQVVYATRIAFDIIGSIAVDSVGQAWAVGSTCPTVDCSLYSHYGRARAIRKLDAIGTKASVSISQSNAEASIVLEKGATISVRIGDPGGYLAMHDGKTAGAHLLVGVETPARYFIRATAVTEDSQSRLYQIVVPFDLPLRLG